MKFKRFLRTLALVALAAFVGVTMFFWNASTLLGNQMPMVMGHGAAVVLSGSMEPVLSVDDLIVVSQQESYALGQIVVFQNNGSLVVHRIIDIDGTKVTTKGDANNTQDEPIEMERILGKAVFSIPKVGVAVRFLKTPIGFVSVLILALFLLERSYRKEKEADDLELEKIREEIRKLKNGE